MNDAKDGEVERRTGAEFVHNEITEERLMQAKDLHLSETFEEASLLEVLEVGGCFCT